MKRLIFLILSLIMMLLLTGCQNPVSKLLYKHTDSYIADFKKTIEESVEEKAEIPKDKVRVTFAKNEFLNIEYYKDSEFKDKIDIENCLLNPGTTIYAKLEVNNTITKAYEFDEYRIYSYDSDGKSEWIGSLSTEDLVYKIPETYGGYDLSIKPIGKYVPMGISHQAYIIDENGNKKKANVDDCQWYINDEKLTDNQTVSVSEYSISCKEINDNYYCSNSSPVYYSRDLSDKSVVFPLALPTEEPETYVVYLRKYISLNIDANSKSDIKIKVKRGNDEYKEYPVVDDKVEKIVIGDNIRVEIKSGYELSSGSLYQYFSEPEIIENGEKIRYTFTIPELDDIQLDLLVRKSEDLVEFKRLELDNASIEYQIKNSHNTLIDGVKYDKDTKITYTIWPNSGYYVCGKGTDLIDGEYVFTDTVKLSALNEKVKESLKVLKIKKLKTITLDNSDEYGTVSYTVNGKTLFGKQNLREEDIIELNYVLPKDGKYVIERGTGILNKVSDWTKKYSETKKIEVSSIKSDAISRNEYIAIKEVHSNG